LKMIRWNIALYIVSVRKFALPGICRIVHHS
jgi:hypothetical protein